MPFKHVDNVYVNIVTIHPYLISLKMQMYHLTAAYLGQTNLLFETKLSLNTVKWPSSQPVYSIQMGTCTVRGR